MKDKTRNIILIVLVVCLIGLTVAYATLSSNLKISGTASVNKSEWKIHFDNLKEPAVTGSAEKGKATLNDSKTTLTISVGVFKAPGDKITYIVDVVNEGDIDAKVEVISTIIGDCASEDGSDVTKYCNKIKAKIVYSDTNEEVKESDELNKGESKTLKLIITYDENRDLTSVANTGIILGDITSSITYTMKEKSSGSDIPDTPKNVICKRATTLHTEECTQTSSYYYCSQAGYTESGSKGTTTITYGNLGTSGTLTSGDAFDCDVNGDGAYDSKTERFYYVSDYYDAITKSFDSDYATLFYYNYISGGESSNSMTYAYDSSNKNYNGPVSAITSLPTTSEWSNIALKNTERQILTQTGTTSTKGGKLPQAFSYSGYSARLLTAQELENACNMTIGPTIEYWEKGQLDSCIYLMENTIYSNSSLIYGYWLENPDVSHPSGVWVVDCGMRTVFSQYSNISDSVGVRPAIDVLKSNISY